MKALFISTLIACALKGCAQSNTQEKTKTAKHIGGRCEGCEAIYESPLPFEKLSPIDTLPDFKDAGPKIEISGIVYKADGKTPAKDVVIYVYHTDQMGVYPKKGNNPDSHREGWGKRHGYIRGWMKTDKYGRYKFFTLKPAAYPGQNQNPSHIHITIKEPDKNEYWLDDYLFDDDPLLTGKMRKSQQNRGGSGIISLKAENNISRGTRNIVLGKNISGYPVD